MATEERNASLTRRERRERSPFIPFLILALAVTGWAAFQMTQLLRERDSLETARSNQERPMENSKKLRDQLDGLARETQLLANKGNAGARLIVDELKKRGITINPEPPATPVKK
jgi:hypothetical protein